MNVRKKSIVYVIKGISTWVDRNYVGKAEEKKEEKNIKMNRKERNEKRNEKKLCY